MGGADGTECERLVSVCLPTNYIMTNIEKYNCIFKKLLNVSDGELESLAYKETAEWNSLVQIALVAEVEEVFDIDFDTDDLFDFKSYIIGKELLINKYSIEF